MTDSQNYSDAASAAEKRKKKAAAKKKAANKAAQQAKAGKSKNAQSDSKSLKNADRPTTPEEPVTPLFTLPVQPDEWFVVPGEKDPEGNLLTPDRFVFLKENNEIISLDFTEKNFGGLHTVMNNTFINEDIIPDHWSINVPLISDDDENNPVMSLSKNGKILAATSLDQASLKKMSRAINRHIVRPPTITKSFGEWWLRHKYLRVLLSVVMLPIISLILYALVWGLSH